MPLPPSPATPSTPAADPCEGLPRWEQFTRQAQSARRQGRLERALAGHVQALWTVEALLDGPLLALHPDDCLAALVVSHHNLAELYGCRGQGAQAVGHLCQAHELLLRLAGDGHVPHDVRQAAWRHLRETHAELAAWQRDHGPEPAIEAALHLPDAAALARHPPHLH